MALELPPLNIHANEKKTLELHLISQCLMKIQHALSLDLALHHGVTHKLWTPCIATQQLS